MEPATAPPRPPPALTVVLVLVTVETAAEVAFVLGGGHFGPGGRALLALLLLAKVVLAARARKLHADGAVGLLLFELIGVLVALGADWPVPVRLALVACVVAVFVLVLASLHAFPMPELP